MAMLGVFENAVDILARGRLSLSSVLKSSFLGFPEFTKQCLIHFRYQHNPTVTFPGSG